jgi:hypothetical protein
MNSPNDFLVFLNKQNNKISNLIEEDGECAKTKIVSYQVPRFDYIVKNEAYNEHDNPRVTVQNDDNPRVTVQNDMTL